MFMKAFSMIELKILLCYNEKEWGFSIYGYSIHKTYYIIDKVYSCIYACNLKFTTCENIYVANNTLTSII